MSPISMLMVKIQKHGINECWPWLGAKATNGYGAYRNMNAHRATYLLLVGKIPDGMVVCHKCDNQLCCNPTHLWIGTQKDNMRDMHAKGRNYNGHDLISSCPSGHEYTAENTRTHGNKRICRQCDRDRNKDNEARLAASRERSRRRRSQYSARKQGIT